MDYDLIVIGGGPAGMLSAATAAAKGLNVILLEKNEKLGKKLYLTGKGRCNVTNYGDINDFFDNVTTNPKFLYSAFKSFDNYGLVELLNSLGVPTKVEQGNRVFPASDKSSDVIKALQKHLQKNKVEIELLIKVKKITFQNKQVTGVFLNSGEQITAPKVIIATGGMSYPQTGSTGDGYSMARQLGHTIKAPKPALIPLVIKENWVKKLQGLSLKNVSIKALLNNKVKAEQFGEMIFTHFGVSGPIILTLSSLIRDYIAESTNKPVQLFIDLKPALTLEQLDARLQRDFNKFSGKQLKNALDDLLPQKMISVVLYLSGINIHKQVNQINRNERLLLAHTLKNIPMTVTGTRPLSEAIVTSGGINVKEINPSTLESKIIKGLYFAGEVIDVDALTGGYNLQIAFSTGFLSGVSAAEA
ncbi:soluble pyridine nucleotide transhydrogenase [Sporotomaculum syntrophicum]|uniref:Soluble pyridine nucleotide transhydrogenase n=1 Tax=Sporotomaculum syntrophicum TaxID=182264 RepID=A0A9D2WRP0_9FIRM|nr:NAD(P)/FAD-dependent oxidoreductase [Sporotomaculum syntrophicum]KAF1085880.1 soluble pyridine nucleotide transhydrogenase [Sporotomaculum syntrophicum]